MKITPIGNKILIEPLETESVSKGGILIPETAKSKPKEGKILALGAGLRNEKGELLPFNVAVGDKVIFNRYGLEEIKIDDKEFYIATENEILAIVK